MRIVIADDDPSVRGLLEMQLELEGHEVVTAADGLEALARVESVEPDLLVLDVMMPGLSGWEVLERLRAGWGRPGLPVVLVTARDLPDDRQRARELSAIAVFAKPHDGEALVATVEGIASMLVARG